MRVIIASPYSGGTPENIHYARNCLIDSMSRDESPFASHLLYTQVLDDDVKEERALGIDLATPWYEVADLCALYLDLGMTSGMEIGALKAMSFGIKIVERRIYDVRAESFGESVTTH